jgi:predicted transcriptional regulator
MAQASPTISIRLPDADRVRLDKAVKQTRRSRSYLMKEALDRHLAEIVREQSSDTPKQRLSKLLSLEGKGVRPGQERTVEEINRHIRWLRGDEGV